MSLWNHGLLMPLLISAIYWKTVISTESGDNDSMGEWGEWGSWSRCSRSCGIGIKTRTRECNLPYHKYHKGKMKTTCVGDYKLFQTCNKQACSSGNKDFRVEQCEKFNSKLVGGRRYRWEPYYNGGDKCKLSCRAKGHRFYAKLANVVIDGTPCTQGDPYHICIAGSCKKIGCDGVLGSDVKFDKCGVCGGDNTTCHIISGIFTRTQLRYGYNHITRFPKGACNINVTEMFPSDNYLALRVTNGKYIVNGNRALGFSNNYEAVGTTVKYHRPGPNDLEDPVEYIYVNGPTDSSLELMVGVPGGTKDSPNVKAPLIKQTNNRGILYSYTIPMDSHHHKNDKSHHKHRHNHHDESDDDIKNNLTYKTPPKYVEPEYKDKEKQVAALSVKNEKSDRYQNDDPERINRYKSYLDQIREQRENARRRNAEKRKNQENRNNNNNNFGTVNDGRHKKPPTSASQTHHGYTGNNKRAPNNNRKQQSQATRGVPLVLNNQVGVPLKSHNSRIGGVPLVSNRNQRGGNYNSRRTHYYSSAQGPVPLKNSHVAQSYTSNRQNGYQYGAGLSPQPVPIPAPNNDISRTQSGGYTNRGYYGGAGDNARYQNQRNARPGIPAPNYGDGQPGINFGVKPGQPLQPNPSSHNAGSGYQGQVYQPASHFNYDTNRNPGSSYINYNQQPVYVPPSYAAHRGNQGFQSGNTRPYTYGQPQDGSVNNPRYVANRNSNVQLGTLDTTAEYSWKISGFTECSRTCGGGSQDTLIVCVKVDSQTVVTDENCDSGVKPTIQSVTCNNVPCSPAWETGEWSECSTTCGRGTKTRTVECRQRVSASIQISVSASRCQGVRRPESRQVCNTDKPCVRWRIGEWGKCSAECGRGQRTREVVCLDASENAVPENKCDSSKPRAVEICDMGSCAKTWFFTEWSKQCSTECGEGYKKRAVYCSADPERCSSIRKPNDKKPCKSDIPCGGKWFTGPWTKCSATCGDGVISRDVICMKKSGRALGVVGEENCLLDDKPSSNKPCKKNPCQPEWFMTKWTDCSRTCDTGTQTREVKCLDASEELSNECNLDKKPGARQSCNTESCQTRSKSNNNKQSPGQCADQYTNCVLVVQARLCNYEYYKGLCCHSCSSHDHDHEDT